MLLLFSFNKLLKFSGFIPKTQFRKGKINEFDLINIKTLAPQNSYKNDVIISYNLEENIWKSHIHQKTNIWNI